MWCTSHPMLGALLALGLTMGGARGAEAAAPARREDATPPPSSRRNAEAPRARTAEAPRARNAEAPQARTAAPPPRAHAAQAPRARTAAPPPRAGAAEAPRAHHAAPPPPAHAARAPRARAATTLPHARTAALPPRQGYHAATAGFGAIQVGSAGAAAGTFLGGMAILQAGHLGYLVGVVELGVGAALDDDPNAPGTHRTSAQLWLALGGRVRLLRLLHVPREAAWDLSVGPLAGVLGSHEVVTLALGGELALAYHIGRVRLSLTAQGGWAHILAQEVADRLQATYFVGGILAVGARF